MTSTLKYDTFLEDEIDEMKCSKLINLICTISDVINMVQRHQLEHLNILPNNN